MKPLNPSSKAILTTEEKDSQTGVVRAFASDLDGNPLGPTVPPLLILTDSEGKRFARVAAVKPTQRDPLSVALLEALESQNPVFFDDPDAEIRGWYVPVDKPAKKSAAA